MADIESTPQRKKRQRRPPLVGETKLFDNDPEYTSIPKPLLA